MKTMKKWFGSFQKKIIISFVLLSSAFVLLTTVIAGIVLVRGYETQTGERLAFEQRQLLATLHRVAGSANDCANRIVIQLNSDKRISLSEIAQSSQSELASMEFLLGVAKNNLRLLPDINSINILLANGFLYTAAENQPVSFYCASESFTNALLQLPITAKGGFCRLDSAGYDPATLFYCKQLRDITTNRAVGIVYLEILPQTLENYCQTGQGSAVVLTDSAGTILAKTGAIDTQGTFAVPTPPEGRLRVENTTWLYRTGTVPRSGWQLTCLLDESVSLTEISRGILWLALACLVLLSIMTLLTVVIARTLSRPVQELSAHMISSTGNLPVPISPPHQDDEIATLYANFNSMLEQNRQLFTHFKAEQKQKIRTELALVQSQIKPHFLYNTLDTIYCLAHMNRAQEAGEITKALADYYRLVLNSGEERITVERELCGLQQYLAIMQVRYRGMLQYRMACDERAKQVPIPKLLLQPLVENAIYHGIKPKQQPGTLDISVRWEDDAVVFSVSDDGVGMTQQQFAQALRGEKRTEDGETFGMHSVARRVQLFYGENSRLSLTQENGLTCVSITIYPSEVRDV